MARATGLAAIAADLPAADAIAAHPGFDAAARALAGGMLDHVLTSPQLAGLFKDAGRYVAALCAAALQQEGVTLAALKQLTARFGLLSSGRARALLLYMRYLGLVTPMPGTGRPARYQLTDAFAAAWRAQAVTAVTAAALVAPRLAGLPQALAAAPTFARFCRLQLDRLAEGAATLPRVAPRLLPWLDRHAGSPLLWSLATMGNGGFPAPGPLHLNVAALARQLAVTPLQIRRLLRAGIDTGLLAGDGELCFTAAGRAEIRAFYAAQLAELVAVGDALGDIRLAPPPVLIWPPSAPAGAASCRP